MQRTPSMEVMSTRQRAVAGFLIGLVVLGLCSLLRGTEAFERPELALLDLRTNTFIGTRPPDPRIVLCVVQEEDLARMSETLGQPAPWPWSHEYQSAGIEFLQSAKVGAILCDMMFSDFGKALEEYKELATDREFFAKEDLRLALMTGNALGQRPRSTVGVYVQESPTWETKSRLALAGERSIPFPEGEETLFPSPMGMDLSVASIFQGARYGGCVQMHSDLDGVVRRVRPVTEAGHDRRFLWPTIGLAAAALLEDVPIRVDRGGRIHLGDREVRVDETQQFLVNFRGPAYETYPTVSFFDLVGAGFRIREGSEPTPHDEALRARLKGKLVVWGSHYIGGFDFVSTPVRHGYLGPELMATIADNMLHGDGRRRVPAWVDFLVLCVVALGLGLLGAVTRQRLLPHLAALALLVALVVSAFGFFRAGWALDLFTPVVAIVLTAVGATTFRLLTEGRRNKWLESTFSRYLAPDVIEALKQDPSRVALGGRRRELTIFFSDVAGFTSLTEQLGSQQIVALLNEYLTRQSALLMEQSGTIDKFQGDAIMAFFGDPLDMADHHTRACRAAVACRHALPELEPVWRKLGLDGFEIRIGLNSGTALVGNMGSEERFDYTCMGDAVNLAARLEGANKAFGSKIMIGPETYAGAQDDILAKPLADLVVMGKSAAVSVYELVAMQDNATDTERRHVGHYSDAHAAVRAGDLAAAKEALTEAEAVAPGDGPCGWLRSLIAQIETGDVATPWDGKLVMDKK